MIKCNTNRVVKGIFKPYVCGGVFKDYSVDSLGCFTIPLGIHNVLFVEFIRSILAIVVTFEKD